MRDLCCYKKFLHFFQDEKVVNDAVCYFETIYPNQNLFIVLSKDGQVRWVKPYSNVLFLKCNAPELKYLIHNCDSFNEIICHSLWYELSRIIKQMKHPNITWVIWGADLYEDLLLRKGYKIYIDQSSIYRVKAGKIPVVLFKVLKGIRDFYYYFNEIAAIKRVASICCLQAEQELLESYYPNFHRFKRKEFFYYPVEKMLDSDTINGFVYGRDIWVNNSAGYNGNHIDVFQRIKELHYNGTVHVPLSYGIPKCAKYVEEEGYRILGNQFDPLLTYIPKNEYYKRFLSSNSFVFGHLRQCAYGNITIALYLGAKVFLFKQNPLYSFFKGHGVILYCIEDEMILENVTTPLAEVDRQLNRSIIMRLFSYQQLINNIKLFFS